MAANFSISVPFAQDAAHARVIGLSDAVSGFFVDGLGGGFGQTPLAGERGVRTTLETPSGAGGDRADDALTQNDVPRLFRAKDDA